MVRRKKPSFKKVEALEASFFGKEAGIEVGFEAGFTVAMLVSILEVGLRSSIFFQHRVSID